MPKKLQRKVAPKKAAPAVADNKQETGGGGLFSRRVTPRLLNEFTNQLAVLLDAGIPVTKCLRILQGQMPPGAMKKALLEIREDVEGGTSLSESFAKQEHIFDSLYTNMVAAGEAGGVQDVILNRLADFMESQEDIKSRVKGALAYPIAVLCVAVLVLVLVFIFVIPKFREIFIQQFGSVEALPTITQFVINTADHLKQTWWAYFGGLFVLWLVHSLFRRKWQAYNWMFDGLLLRIPLFGTLVKRSLVARFSRTFGTLIESGVPHLEALEILGNALPNVRMVDAVNRIRGSIREGSGIATPMGQSGIFDDIVINMVDVGEETGELDRMLGKIADRYEIEVKRTVDSTFKFIEPLLLVVMAVVVGVIVFALFTPLLKLMEKFS
ncbi:MAG: type II secretion system F family protein [Planctomycetota bacterium]|nr:type II secretion system F family protein [Planctomycetota bacterium]